MSDIEPPTLIIPTKRCWLWWARRPHRPHLHGLVPNTRRCPGIPAPTDKAAPNARNPRT